MARKYILYRYYPERVQIVDHFPTKRWARSVAESEHGGPLKWTIGIQPDLDMSVVERDGDDNIIDGYAIERYS